MAIETLPQARSEEIFATLHQIVVEQQAELQAENPPSSFETRKQLLSWYKQGSRFKNLFKEAVRYNLLPLTDEEAQRIEHRLAGGIFQDISFYTLVSRQSDNRVLVSPERTLQFFQVLFPHAQLMEYPFHISSLMGISVPDGLIIKGVENDQPRITTVCEFTATGKRKVLESKYLGFQIDRDKYHQFFADAKLLFVTPQGYHSNFISYKGAELEEVPFRYDQLRDFVDTIYYHYSPDPDGAALADMQERAREQWKRTQEFKMNGDMTPQYRQYLSSVEQARQELKLGPATTPV